MKGLDFSIDIAAPVARVWDCMFDPLVYRDWTRAFAEGSYYEGRWEAGQRLRFLAPGGCGMEGVLDECRLHERVVLRLLGEIKDGRAVADSPLRGEPAFECYDFSPTASGGTALAVQLLGWDAHREFLEAAWPVALQRLKVLAETPL